MRVWLRRVQRATMLQGFSKQPSEEPAEMSILYPVRSNDCRILNRSDLPKATASKGRHVLARDRSTLLQSNLHRQFRGSMAPGA
jgi:hypothetical protein